VSLSAIQQYHRIQTSIHSVSLRIGRKPDVLLLPVSKTQSIEAIKAFYDLGFRDFGESRVQELLKKRDELPSDIRWHFIGHLQSNKARQIAPFIEWIHSIDSIETALELSRRAKQDRRIINILAEVNISAEPQKNGVEPEDALSLVESIQKECTNLSLRGLMGMASEEEDIERTRPQFRKLRELRDTIRERHPELTSFTELSMGMSNDFEIAIEEGATIVRIGSALFGERE
jgi:pyridoxal phosphate enzyme (YggS family)